MEMLWTYHLQDSHYGIGLHGQIQHVVAQLSAEHCRVEWHIWELSSLSSTNCSAFLETLIIHLMVNTNIITPPVQSSMMPSPSKTALPADLSPKVTKPPHPVMIKRPQPPRELSFANYHASNKVEKASKPAAPAPAPSSKIPAPTIPFSFLACMPYAQSPILSTPQKAQASIFHHVGPKKVSLSLKKPIVTAKKPVIPAPPITSYEDEEMEGEEAEEEGAVEEELIEEDSSLTSPLVKLSSVPALPLPPAAPSEKTKGKQKAAVPPSPSPPPQPAKQGHGQPPSFKNKKGQGAFSMQKSIHSHLKASIVTGHSCTKAASEALSYEAPSPNSQDKIPEEEMEPVPEDKEEAMQKGDSAPHVMGDVPIASGSGMPEEELSLSIHSVTVDDTVYAHAFHPLVDLQFHEPLSCQALEHFKLLALPPAPASLSKPSTEMHNGHPAAFRAHSDLSAHILHMPNIFHPCFNCSFSSFPELCEFTGEIGKEACTKYRASRHGKCSA
ncbi:uncharacterized protein EV420DRAFT_1487732 [Desarmillaria tabescens]|uniref:Uncharacterized protein n=1 Tax=Armillaria tabescens TaxID=1929756 RepID=A0AA39J6X9_ARMTA|nr:uncharacterized protein EV420DRAFT_1487732 [Desarmillaria tabescens]KAK0435939.1 hypothetical protein EV420DRAFT_1487732 [Desarmillaria tabescens]